MVHQCLIFLAFFNTGQAVFEYRYRVYTPLFQIKLCNMSLVDAAWLDQSKCKLQSIYFHGATLLCYNADTRKVIYKYALFSPICQYTYCQYVNFFNSTRNPQRNGNFFARHKIRKITRPRYSTSQQYELLQSACCIICCILLSACLIGWLTGGCTFASANNASAIRVQ